MDGLEHNQKTVKEQQGRKSLIWVLFFTVALAFLAGQLLDLDFPALFGIRRPPAEPRSVAPVSGELGADESATIEVFEQMAPSVVFIKNASLVQLGFFSLNLYEIPQGAGSGIIWDRNGHIVTNYHVVRYADKIEVVLADQKSYQARVVGLAPDYDLAVLKIRASTDELQPVLIGTSKDLRVGQKVLAIGNPFGLDHSLTTGVISALGRTIEALTGTRILDVIQTDAAINPGNSGGPLLDSYGRLIGLNTAIVGPAGGNIGVGFAVPVDTINRVVPQLIQKGRITKAGLGISLVPDSLRRRWGIGGAVILDVVRGGAADRVGLIGTSRTVYGELVLGDVIVKIDGVAVRENEDLISHLESGLKVGGQVEIEFMRRGSRQRVTVVLQEI